MPCSSTSQLTNANSVTLPGTIPTTQAQWSVFVQRLQQMLNLVGDATTKTGVNVIPPTYAVYDGAALPALTVTGATPALDSSLSQFGNASLKLTATATTVTVEFPSGAIPIAPFTRWIESVYIQSSRTSITGTLATVTASGSYSVNIGGTLTPAQWGRLYGDCALTADSSTAATLLLTLTGVTVGDTFHLEAWQLEAASGQTNLPTAFNLSRAPGALGQVPDDTTYAKILASHTAGNVSYNFRGVWASGTAYLIGDEAVYAGSYWLCTQANTGQAPAQSSAYWQAVGAYNDYQGAWSATVAYQPGMEVTYGGNFWVCAVANANSAPAAGNANWAMAGPQSLDNITDGSSRFAATGPGTTPLVNNPYFSTGNLSGWTVDHSSVYYENGTNGPSSSTSYAVFPPTVPAEALRNTARIPVYPGAQIKAQCAIRGVGAPNGTANVRISWRDSTDTEISDTQGNTTTGNATNGSYVVGTAPANAMFAHVECQTANHTVGYYTVDNFWAAPLADTMDQVPDGSVRGAVPWSAPVNLLVNPTGALGLQGWTSTGGWNSFYGGGADGYSFSNITSAGNLTSTSTVVAPAIPMSVGLDMYSAGVTAGQVGAALRFLNSSGGLISQVLLYATNGRGWTHYSGSGTSPTGTASWDVLLFINVGVANTNFAVRNIMVNYGANPAPYNDIGTQRGNQSTAPGTNVHAYADFGDNTAGGHVGKHLDNMLDGPSGNRSALANADIFVSGGVNRVGLRIPGSGHTVGDQRNMLMQTWGGMRSVLSSSPISFSISGTTVSFSVAAVTLQGGGVNLNYATSSGSVTQAAGTTATYFLYYIDNAQAGGSLPLNITTNPGGPASWPNGMLLGTAQVTVASGGGGTGGTGSGGGGYCVADDMYISAGRLAGDAEIGDPFDCIDLPTAAGKHVRALQGVSRGTEECVRMITSNGCALVCSVSTPFDLPDGRNTTAPHMLGERVITDLGTATVVSIALVGPKPVTRAHLGGVSYAAGADPQRRIYSHNAGVSKP